MTRGAAHEGGEEVAAEQNLNEVNEVAELGALQCSATRLAAPNDNIAEAEPGALLDTPTR